MIFETRVKSCIYSPTSSIRLETLNGKIWIEIRDSSRIISRIEFPGTKSGYSYATRVFNGLK